MSTLRKADYHRSKDEAFLDELARLLASGLSHSQCCKALGLVSRNVTIGIVNRARASGDARFSMTESAKAVAAVRAARAAMPKAAPKAKAAGRLRPLPRLVLDRCLSDLPMFSPRAAYLEFAPVIVQKSVVDVGTRECRFIAGDPRQGALCCAGATEAGVSYCDYHRRLVWSGRRA